MEKWCRWLAVISQMASCQLVPCAFLVFGGTLLDVLSEGAHNTTYWIWFMALMCLPVCLILTLKEESGAAFAGCAGTLIADVIGVAVVIPLAFVSIVFLILARISTRCVRHHGLRLNPVPDPRQHGPSVRRQITDILLNSIYLDTNGLTTLGFRSYWGAVVMAYFFMQPHIAIAFSVNWQSPLFVF
ncbi:LOW QUALITY PROTEIN: Amino Acid/Auxin Permease [Phytophthora megakarya]|uniref:Amino Acid/Auxin Permease n=1 Tax=Phytophthora megakarya TaxID=4795 RepID=A0A225V232_9STRA|nr:LOW QUALITY PROTEIN: Amino Acid/Auxin Permease [Phytophthora megakarya]